MIGTVAGARARGATGSDSEVEAALADAAVRVEAFCRDVFEPKNGQARTLTMANGIALAPVRLRAVSAVVSGSTTLPATAWRLVPNEGVVDGSGDYMGVEVAVRGGDGLIVGAEPWNGGWANLYDPDNPRLTVTGDWGWAAPPTDVVEAVERVAAIIAPAPYEPAADSEGNPVGLPNPDAVTPAPEPVRVAQRTERTTGSAIADRLLAPYRRSIVRVT